MTSQSPQRPHLFALNSQRRSTHSLIASFMEQAVAIMVLRIRILSTCRAIHATATGSINSRGIRRQWHLRAFSTSLSKGTLVGRQLNRDKKGKLQTTNFYVSEGPQESLRAENPGHKRQRSFQEKTEDAVQNAIRALLPRDYPESVRQGYKGYILLQMGASLASSANGVLSTQALLYAMGLGAGSIPLAAALNWVLKDGIGQVGGIVFASMVNDKFDSNPKRWKMVSAISLDAACFLELMTPLAPGYFLAIASLANVGKNVCYLSSSASRAAIHNSFAIRENLADITAKSGSQSIITSIVGTSLGIALSSTLGSSWSALLPVFATLSCVHLTCNYLSLGHVSLNTINTERFELILKEFDATGRVPPPTQVAVDERFFFSADSYKRDPSLPMLHVARALSEAVSGPAQLAGLAQIYAQDSYILNARGKERAGTACVDLLFKEDADMSDVVCGFFHAHVLQKELQQAGWTDKPRAPLTGESLTADVVDGEVWLDDLLRSTYHKVYTPLITDAVPSATAAGGHFHHPTHHHEREGQQHVRPGDCLPDLLLRQLEASGWMLDNLFLPHADNRVVLEAHKTPPAQ